MILGKTLSCLVILILVGCAGGEAKNSDSKYIECELKIDTDYNYSTMEEYRKYQQNLFSILVKTADELSDSDSAIAPKLFENEPDSIFLTVLTRETECLNAVNNFHDNISNEIMSKLGTSIISDPILVSQK